MINLRKVIVVILVGVMIVGNVFAGLAEDVLAKEQDFIAKGFVTGKVTGFKNIVSTLSSDYLRYSILSGLTKTNTEFTGSKFTNTANGLGLSVGVSIGVQSTRHTAFGLAVEGMIINELEGNKIVLIYPFARLILGDVLYLDMGFGLGLRNLGTDKDFSCNVTVPVALGLNFVSIENFEYFMEISGCYIGDYAVEKAVNSNGNELTGKQKIEVEEKIMSGWVSGRVAVSFGGRYCF